MEQQPDTQEKHKGFLSCFDTPVQLEQGQGKLSIEPLTYDGAISSNTALYDKHWPKDAVEANTMLNHFVEPSDELLYNRYSYVATHNSYTDNRYFKIVRQQDKSVLCQLMYGARGINFDTYNWGDPAIYTLVGPPDSTIALSHDAPGIIANIQKGTFKFQSLKLELRRIVEFMRTYQKAVVTLHLEDYADPTVTSDEIKSVMIDAKYNPLFWPADLPSDGKWPTLGWMREHNKRLVIFAQNSRNTETTFHKWTYFVENKYGTVDDEELCQLRSDGVRSQSAPLVSFNNFTGAIISPTICESKPQCEYNRAVKCISHCQDLKFANSRLFNAYFVDRLIDCCDELYEEGDKTIFEYVNELNAVI